MRSLLKRISPVFWGLAVGLAILCSCTSPLAFSLRFSRVDGLKQGDPVIFSYQSVGRVKEITYTRDADFLVGVEIQKEFLYLATEDSRFFIGDSPLDAKRKAVLLEQEKPGGKPIAQDSVVRGSSPADSVKQTADSLARIMETAFSSLLRELENFQESEEYEDLKKKLSELETRLKSSGKEMEKTIREEILPNIEKKLKEIIKELEDQGQKDKARELQKEYRKLQDV
ncbi:MlaD family protein [Desulfospira joergensenii]|uniref:MlaD family protein n=1 Tax=Desulfospira joergensenii TaxID=53329 RepID=UPI0004234574|nr:MlaD family protein [Desulfospira joergensenii]